jgi:hypothetical protein
VLGLTLVREDERGKKKAGAIAMRWGVGMDQGRFHTVARRGGSVGPVWHSGGMAWPAAAQPRRSQPAAAQPRHSRPAHVRGVRDRR